MDLIQVPNFLFTDCKKNISCSWKFSFHFVNLFQGLKIYCFKIFGSIYLFVFTYLENTSPPFHSKGQFLITQEPTYAEEEKKHKDKKRRKEKDYWLLITLIIL